MKEISASQITQTVKDLFLEACLCPPGDVVYALERAHQTEVSPQGKETLSQLLTNAKISLSEQIPYCQDTGMAVVFADIGQDIHITGDFNAAINEGVRQAYGEGYYRKSVLSAINRKNTLDNTPAIIHTRIVPGNSLMLTAAPKGFGSENMSQIKMLKPSDGVQGIINFVVQSARDAGASPCPPVILGIGIGGTFEYTALMAKRQLLRTVGQPNQNPLLAGLEEEIKERINALGMGPGGLGGRHYCLAVHIEEHETHLAGLPVAVNFLLPRIAPRLGTALTGGKLHDSSKYTHNR